MPRQRVPRTRNNGTWTEAQFFAYVRSSLRNAFRYWKPIQACRKRVRKKIGVKQYVYQCESCKEYFDKIEVDHNPPVGSLKSYEDLAGFLERLTAEDGYRALCKQCHHGVTQNEKNK